MWPGTVFNNLTNGRTAATLKAWSTFTLRYTAVPSELNSMPVSIIAPSTNDGCSGDDFNLTGNMKSRKIILPLDVEDTVTCFCRFVVLFESHK